MHTTDDPDLRRSAERTVPRGANAQDRSTAPAIDMDIWTDHVRVARSEDGAALCRLVEEYAGYARALAARLHRGHEPFDDLEQVAMEALVVSLRRFDPERGVPFVAFATPTIVGAIRRHYRDCGWLIRVPRRIHEFASAERAVAERLSAGLGRPPTPVELAEALDMGLDDLLAAQDAVHARDARSIDAPVGEDLTLADQLGRPDDELALAEDRAAAAAAIETLPPSDRALLRLYYLEERTQSEVATILGVSQMQVSRLLSSVLRRLHAKAA